MIGVITRDSEETVPSAKRSLLTLPLVLWNLITCHNVLAQQMILTGLLPSRITRDISIDAVQVYTDGSKDDYYRSGSGIYIKSQDHILRIERRNPDGCSVFRSELIAIDKALGSLASLPNGKEIWILSDSRSAIQHLSNWQSVRDNVGASILTKLKRLSTSHQIHLQWIPSHIDLEGNEISDTFWPRLALARYQSRQHPSTFWRFSLELNPRIKPLGLPPQSTIDISALVLEALWLTVLQDRIKIF
ncbi:RNase H domain-containing protein [Trichonephila clavipes]|nr:RNase H domain-containing protein [Trichonephila clavipes]